MLVSFGGNWRLSPSSWLFKWAFSIADEGVDPLDPGVHSLNARTIYRKPIPGRDTHSPPAQLVDTGRRINRMLPIGENCQEGIDRRWLPITSIIHRFNK